MAKGKSAVYFCQSCGYESAKWMGQCPGCHEWNTFVEELVDKKTAAKAGGKQSQPKAKPQTLAAIELRKEHRMTSGMPELDRVLGGGVVPGSMVLVGGDPGIGKSTLLLQVCKKLADQHISVL